VAVRWWRKSAWLTLTLPRLPRSFRPSEDSTTVGMGDSLFAVGTAQRSIRARELLLRYVQLLQGVSSSVEPTEDRWRSL
jgi:hypothetical protein